MKHSSSNTYYVEGEKSHHLFTFPLLSFSSFIFSTFPNLFTSPSILISLFFGFTFSYFFLFLSKFNQRYWRNSSMRNCLLFLTENLIQIKNVYLVRNCVFSFLRFPSNCMNFTQWEIAWSLLYTDYVTYLISNHIVSCKFQMLCIDSIIFPNFVSFEIHVLELLEVIQLRYAHSATKLSNIVAGMKYDLLVRY